MKKYLQIQSWYQVSFLLFLLIGSITITTPVSAQNDCMLYGSITTIEGKTYEGPIRWGDEEVFLSDIFNSEKISNPYLKYLNKSNFKTNYKSSSRSSNKDWINVSVDNKRHNTNYLARKFQCRFGDIKSITITGRESVNLELKSEKYINLSGGSNDVNTRISIIDIELGMLSLNWNKIDVIKFFRPKQKISDSFGQGIYGKLTTTQGVFTGFVQWDHDERLLDDKLDGKSSDGDLKIPFRKIKNITKQENACLVKLASGREIELYGTNDVNSSNKGIIVNLPNIGRADFHWKHFISFEILEEKTLESLCDKSFPNSERLYGKVFTKTGEELEGVIVYDLDEAMDSELLNGYNDDIKFSIPFRNIESIKPMANNYAAVVLKSGEKLFLGDQADVSNKNAGILIFTSSEEFSIFKWDEIEKIVFQN
ncbi:hypothetical protein DWB61_04550 [Ancylomarina euxinus]|uniref:Uncharacterized protein n=1 Tax=Ancylomarina euxinus TaxID=2283627 RepID=A0A425Y591_9BACT|nr:hypothetical protein [Ancylomarina euxinus]MCZ4694315.1 hypothetical protein [Ancylomarina euxinus]MUP14354.1 hypothetical protein [Ancylomarina euxinus]RRG23666.1 hypothetical protein DWB61_04550 [Ancylomarina euxinus]